MLNLEPSPHNFDTQIFFECQSDQRVAQLIIKPFDISQISKIVSLSWKKSQVFPSLLLFFIYVLDNTSHKFCDQSLSPFHYQCSLQVSETVSWYKLCCCYSFNMLKHGVGGRGLIYFCKVEHSRFSINFSRNWLGLSSLCEIL